MGKKKASGLESLLLILIIPAALILNPILQIIKAIVENWFIFLPIAILFITIYYFNSDYGRYRFSQWKENRKNLKKQKEHDKMLKDSNLKFTKINEEFNIDALEKKIKDTDTRIRKLKQLKEVAATIDIDNSANINEFNRKYSKLMDYLSDYYIKLNCLYIKAIFNKEIALANEHQNKNNNVGDIKTSISSKLLQKYQEIKNNALELGIPSISLIESAFDEAMQRLKEFIAECLNLEANKILSLTSPLNDSKFIFNMQTGDNSNTYIMKEYENLTEEYERLCAEIELMNL